MSVQYIKEESNGTNLLGALGKLATLGGMVTGQGWLTGLGTGLGTMDGIIKGTATNEEIKTLGDMLKEMGTKWKKLIFGNIAKVKPETDTRPLEMARNEMQGVTPNAGPYETAATQAMRYLYGGY